MKIDNIGRKNILVIGDVMIDTYYSGDVKRISPEAPVPVFRKKAERSVLGGAANVAANLVAAGQNVSVMAMVGNDDNANKLKDIFEKSGINTKLVISLNRKTTEKTRFLASNNQQVLRLDVEDTAPLSIDDGKRMLDSLAEVVDQFDLILLSDYLKGLLTYEFTQGVLQLAKSKGIHAIIDVKDPKTEKYKDAYLLKPNQKEIHELIGMPVGTDEEIAAFEQEYKRQGVRDPLDIMKSSFYPLLAQKIKKSWQHLFTDPLPEETYWQGAVWYLKKDWVVGEE